MNISDPFPVSQKSERTVAVNSSHDADGLNAVDFPGMTAEARQIGLNCTPGLGNCVAQRRQQVREPSRCSRSAVLSHH